MRSRAGTLGAPHLLHPGFLSTLDQDLGLLLQPHCQMHASRRGEGARSTPGLFLASASGLWMDGEGEASFPDPP